MNKTNRAIIELVRSISRVLLVLGLILTVGTQLMNGETQPIYFVIAVLAGAATMFCSSLLKVKE